VLVLSRKRRTAILIDQQENQYRLCVTEAIVGNKILLTISEYVRSKGTWEDTKRVFPWAQETTFSMLSDDCEDIKVKIWTLDAQIKIGIDATPDVTIIREELLTPNDMQYFFNGQGLIKVINCDSSS